MYEKTVIFLILFSESAFKVSSDGGHCDLNLSQIFRTPKDFSQVNFDHFEILERNNFDEGDRAPVECASNDYPKKDSRPRSVANAQVMLRFGGDDIRGRNYVDVSGKLHCHRHRFADIPGYRQYVTPNDFECRPYPPQGFPVYPIVAAPPLPVIPPPVPQYYYPYPPSPPYAFPGYYYQLNRQIQYPQYTNQRFVEDDLEPSNADESHFLEFREGRIENRDHPKILKTEDLSEDIIQEATCPKCAENAKEENIREAQGGERKDELVAKQDPSAIIEKVIDHDSKEEKSQGSCDSPSSKLVILSNVEANTVVSNSEPSNVKYLDINLSEFKKETDPAPNAEAWLNNSLVPYSSCTCGQNQKLLVSYPITGNPDEVKPDLRQNDSGLTNECNCIKQKGCCSCCNCDRDPSIPLGQRFPADVDLLLLEKPVVPAKNSGTGVNTHSLLKLSESAFPIHDWKLQSPGSRVSNRPILQIADFLTHGWKSLPSTRWSSSGHTSSQQSAYSSEFSQVGNSKPKVRFNGYRTSSNSGYYVDPSRQVYYQEPTTLDTIEIRDPSNPVTVHTKTETPHIYQVVPKYNIVFPKIVNLDIPDLVPTNRYICPVCRYHHQLNTGKYCPIHLFNFRTHRSPGDVRICQRSKRHVVECNCQRNGKYQRRYGNRNCKGCKCRQCQKGSRYL